MFDITLMVCLLRWVAYLNIQDHLPQDTVHTADADITMITYYRNYFFHSNSGQLNENKLAEIWNCVVGVMSPIIHYKKDFKIIKLGDINSLRYMIIFTL